MISYQVVNSDEPGILEITSSHDPSVHYMVYISVKPRDGYTSHSGRTNLRGPLADL